MYLIAESQKLSHAERDVYSSKNELDKLKSVCVKQKLDITRLKMKCAEEGDVSVEMCYFTAYVAVQCFTRLNSIVRNDSNRMFHSKITTLGNINCLVPTLETKFRSNIRACLCKREAICRFWMT